MTQPLLKLTLTSIVLLAAFGTGALVADSPVVDDNTAEISGDRHAEHRDTLKISKRYQWSKQTYLVPDVNLIEMNGTVVSLQSELSRDQPVILSFIFTSCATICPILTATLAQAERQLQNEPTVPKLVSVSIDPEYDTPERLRRYASSYRAGPEWDFLTGDTKSIIAVQRAFGAYRGDKMNHIPLTFLRGSSDAAWVRLDGFTTAEDLVREYRNLALN